MTNDPKFPQRLDPAAEKIRRRRSIAIALTLGFMVLAFYVATFVHLGGNVAKGVM
ncbi:protein CoxF [Hyphomicrobium sp.]|uniref:protein CoxF n=1 Tax=Hyphomicrobium sp. TaxID=82 RepID=UPI000FAF6ACD|nr:protein CoxF [Hyphomicrobium sp.]MBN9248931.1 protein CoxF [Hyphomicrobium sp.]RUP07572.1 MAG: protein CoxF [Hyphomicrobium sp.]